MATPSSVTSLAPGHGRITCTLNGCTVAFSELSSTYPLKLLSPRLAANAVAIVYVMSYGGGLVCGDRIKLQVRAEGGSRLLLLSQVGRLLSVDNHHRLNISTGIHQSFQDASHQPCIDTPEQFTGIQQSERQRYYRPIGRHLCRTYERCISLARPRNVLLVRLIYSNTKVSSFQRQLDDPIRLVHLGPQGTRRGMDV